MGTQEGERDWVDVANDLLSKCNLTLRLRTLGDCHAAVFIALYENILGETVPDYIEVPCSQEDDAHNVQSVIDSLSLDYLQISLSHITGENVVRGHRESMKNLLEIFEGLLEYLMEEMSEESQNGDDLVDSLDGEVAVATREQAASGDARLVPRSSSSSTESARTPSSERSPRSWKGGEEEGAESNGELIGLGVSARTFTAKTPASTAAPLDVDPQPPEQSSATQRLHLELQQGEGQGAGPAAVTAAAESCAPPGSDTLVTSRGQHPEESDRASSEKSSSSWSRTRPALEVEPLQPTGGGARRVLFHTQPDVLFLTLQDETEQANSQSPPGTQHVEELEEGEGFRQRTPDSRGYHSRCRQQVGGVEASLSQQREEELQHISENLSHRLEELDQMLKRVLVESGESAGGETGAAAGGETGAGGGETGAAAAGGAGEEDKQSHHSDSVMERRRTPRHTAFDVPDVRSGHRTRSLSPSPPRPCRSLQLQGEMEAIPADGRQRPEEQQPLSSRRKHSKHRLNEAYTEELSRLEARKWAELDQERLRAQEAERQYREAILGDVSAARTKAQRRPAPPSGQQAVVQRLRQPQREATNRAAPSMRVGEKDLLPLLLEELPHLQLPPAALDKMWRQQLQQVERLHAASLPQRHSKLSQELEEAHRKHDLLLEMVHKDREHRRRLKDFKDRIQQQKSSQNRQREQRQQLVRAKRYHQDFHLQHRARLLRARTKEERMFRQLFEEGLELQKQRLRDQRLQARDQRLEHQRKHQQHIASIENYYKDQFLLLAEKLAKEREEIQLRKKVQEKALLKMKRELRSKMEQEIVELQKIIVQNDEDDHFREADVQRLRQRMRVASFQFSSGYLR
ncbi:centrosomal protein of 95 kDa-like isoform X1 [Nelusetta ayraudi]|uniref:centrosomal protein of 95 kDa-like isoform X1 n=1 Tax=Nelusetta ayraudi TaxID=303726 RepID=UPI003F72E85B